MAGDDASKQRAYLVRELIANLRLRKPAGDQATFRLRLCQKFYAELDQLQPTHLLRAYEALTAVDFPDPDTAALTDHVARRLGVLSKLKSYRNVIIPGRDKHVPPAGGEPPRAHCPHNATAGR